MERERERERNVYFLSPCASFFWEVYLGRKVVGDIIAGDIRIFHCKIRRIIPQLPQFIHLATWKQVGGIMPCIPSSFVANHLTQGCYGGPCEAWTSDPLSMTGP